MIEKGNRSQGIPFLVSGTKSHKLERVPLTKELVKNEATDKKSKGDKGSDKETWFQRLIFENPQVLPTDDLEIGFAPLIPLGLEVSTNVGDIDNLFISPDGYLTIVETKLWRNPEAKRTVVAQIIDYAKELTKLTFEELNSKIKTKNPEQREIIEAVREFEELDEEGEAKLIDNIERNLKRGRFLLLIVGDGIRESVEDMVDYLSNFAQLQFTLGLVELQIYKTGTGDEYIVIPNLVTRTKEIIRSVITIENNANGKITVESDFSEASKSSSSSSKISERDFFEQLKSNTNQEITNFAKRILEEVRNNGYEAEPGKSSFIVKLPSPSGSEQKITMFVIDKEGKIYLTASGNQLKSLGLDVGLSYDYATRTAKLFPNTKQNPKEKDAWSRHPTLEELRSAYEKFMEEVEQYRELIIQKIEAITPTE